MSTTSDFREKVVALGGSYCKWKQKPFCKKNADWAKGGVCSPLVVKWIEQRSSNRSFKVIMDPKTNYKATLDVERLKGGQKYIADYAAKHLKKSGINKSFRTEFAAGVPFESLLHHSTLAGAYYLIGLSSRGAQVNADDVGHAFGIDMTNNCFFDPNVGEATFPDGANSLVAMKELFRWWTKKYYSEYSGKSYIDKFVPS